MGLFDKLLRAGGKALGDAVADSVTDKLLHDKGDVGKALRNVRSAVDSLANADLQETSSRAKVIEEEDDREFDEKLIEVIDKLGAGEYEIRREIPVSELEQEACREIYPRGNNCCAPDDISFGIYRYGERLLLIRLWYSCNTYSHIANHAVKDYCADNGIRMLDFFDYLPNEASYMEERIKAQLG